MVHQVERVEGPGSEPESSSIPSTSRETPQITSTQLASNSKLEKLTERTPVSTKTPLVRSRPVPDMQRMPSLESSGSQRKAPVFPNRLPVRRHSVSSSSDSFDSFESEPQRERLDSLPANPGASSTAREAPPLPLKVQPPASSSTEPSIEGGAPSKYPSAFAPDHSMQPGKAHEFPLQPPPYSPPAAPPQRSRFLDMVPTFAGWGEQVASIGISLVSAWLNIMEKAADAVNQLSKGRG